MFAYFVLGGPGKRQKALSKSRAKPTIILMNKRLGHYSLDVANDAGFTHSCGLVQYQARHMKDRFLAEYGGKMEMEMIAPWDIEPEHQTGIFKGSADAVRQASYFYDKRNYGKKPIGIFSGDIVFDGDIGELLEKHEYTKRKGGLATVAFMKIEDSERLKDFGVAKIDQKGMVTEFFEKSKNPPTDIGNISFYMIEPEIIDFIRKHPEYTDFGGHVFPEASKEGLVYSHIYDDVLWMDMADDAAILDGHMIIKDQMKEGKCKLKIDPKMKYVEETDSVIHESCRINGGRCNIHEESVVRNSVLGESTIIKLMTLEGGMKAPKIERCITYGHATVLGGTDARNTIFDRYSITKHANIHGTPKSPVVVGRKSEISGPLNIISGIHIYPNSIVSVNSKRKTHVLSEDVGETEVKMV